MTMNLVLQGPAMTATLAADAQRLFGANAFAQAGTQAWRCSGIDPHEYAGAVTQFALRRGVDCAWVPQDRRLADLKLIALDMDSTLITIECIDEIGGMLGIKPQIAAITEQAMRGEIDYPESLRRRVALLKGLEVSALQRVYDEKLRLSPGAETLIAAAKSHGIRLLLVSGGFTYYTDRLKARLGLDYAHANVLGERGGLLDGTVAGDIVDAEAKARHMVSLTRSLGLTRSQTLAMGDGANDLAMMAEAGVSVAFRAKPVVRKRATHALDHAGLDGALHLYTGD